MRRTPRGGSGSWFALAEVLKLQESGQFPDEPVKIEVTQIRCVDARTSNSRHKGESIRRIVIIVSAIFSNFVSSIPSHLVTYLHH